MTLNEIFRRTGEPTYHTPVAVVGELVNYSGGQVTIINPPYEPAPRQKRWWKRSFRFMKGRFYITFSNCRVKKRPTSCDHECSQKLTDNMREIKGYRYKQQKGLCPECGQRLRQLVIDMTGYDPHEFWKDHKNFENDESERVSEEEG